MQSHDIPAAQVRSRDAILSPLWPFDVLPSSLVALHQRLPRAKCQTTLARTQAVLVPTNVIPDTPVIKGHDFSQGSDIDGIMAAMLTSGFQATALGQAVNEVNRMVSF
jgi:hypothetical protein